MKTEFFVRMYLGGAAHRWQRDFGKGSGVGGTDSFGSLIDSDGTALLALHATRDNLLPDEVFTPGAVKMRSPPEGDPDASDGESGSEVVSVASAGRAANTNESPAV